MRLKYYLRGLGLGVIFTALILMISFRIHGTSLSDEEIIKRAEKLGMVMPESQQSEDTEALQTLGGGSLNEDSENAEPASEGNTPEPDVPGQGEDTPDDNAQGNSNPEPANQNTANPETPDNGETTPQSVTITVTPGETCRQIAEDLMSHGLVGDAEDFRLYMFNNGYDELILQGSFELPYGASYEQIAAILTAR